MTAVQLGAASLAALPIALLGEGVPAAPADAVPVLAVAGLALAGTALPFWLFAFGQARVPAQLAGAFVNLEPLVGAITGWLAFGEAAAAGPAAGRRRRAARHRDQHDARARTRATTTRRRARSGSSPRPGRSTSRRGPPDRLATMGRVLAVFDGHNDTLTREDADRFVTGRDGGHIDLPRARAGGLGGRDLRLLHGHARTRTRSIATSAAAATSSSFPSRSARTSPPRTRRARSPTCTGSSARATSAIVREIGDLDRAREDGVLAAVAHLEGAEAIDPELETLEFWHAAGLRSIGPVWSRANAFAHGVPFAYPSTGDHGPGLTPAGTALVTQVRRPGHRDRPQPPQRGRLLGRREAGPRAADRLALRRATRCARRAAT